MISSLSLYIAIIASFNLVMALSSRGSSFSIDDGDVSDASTSYGNVTISDINDSPIGMSFEYSVRIQAN